jgi:nucleoside-diphosphate-sugar epimerase
MAIKSKAETLVTVFGGSGFLGRHVVRALANRGYRIRVAVRRPELCGHLRPMGRVGQIHAVPRCATPTRWSIWSASCSRAAISVSTS